MGTEDFLWVSEGLEMGVLGKFRSILKLTEYLKRLDIIEAVSLFFAGILVILIIIFLVEMAIYSLPVFGKFGFGFLVGASWNPKKDVFGALPFIWGTFITSLIAIIFAVIISYGVAYFIVELAPQSIKELLSSIVELIAAIPSVIIGLWGIYYVVPLVRDWLKPMFAPLGFIPLFSGETSGFSYMSAIIVLTLMVSPISTSFFKNALESVPMELKEAAYALGATKYEVFSMVSKPLTRRAVIAGIILAYGRAVGETMAVVMVIGDIPTLSLSFFNPGYTLASVIANEFLEATSVLHVSALIALGLILFVWSFIVNLLAIFFMERWKI